MVSKLKINELRDIAKLLKIKNFETIPKPELLEKINKKMSPKPTSKPTSKSPKYKIGNQIGTTGKDAKTFSVVDKNNNEYAMKVFKPSKPSKEILKEVSLQKKCARLGISPRIIDYDSDKKYIVMEKMDVHLAQIIFDKHGMLSESQQMQLIHIFKMLDTAGVFHGDANPMNYMLKNKKMYIIDFGYSKPITTKLIGELKTKTPNMSVMLLGFIIKLKEMNCDPKSYNKLKTFLPQSQLDKFGI